MMQYRTVESCDKALQYVNSEFDCDIVRLGAIYIFFTFVPAGTRVPVEMFSHKTGIMLQVNLN